MASGKKLNKVAIFALNEDGVRLGEKIQTKIAGSVVIVPATFAAEAPPFIVNKNLENGGIYKSNKGLKELVAETFRVFDGLVMIMALGIVIRMIAPTINNKHEDPAVVVIDEQGQFAISALSGHEGGANRLAVEVASAVGAEPVLTTASDSKKTLSIGIGCRRGASESQLAVAVDRALSKAGRILDDVKWISTVDIKVDEKTISQFAGRLNIPLRYFTRDDIDSLNMPYEPSSTVKKHIGVDGVCEPCAILASGGGRLILKKQIINDVTVAIAERRNNDSQK